MRTIKVRLQLPNGRILERQYGEDFSTLEIIEGLREEDTSVDPGASNMLYIDKSLPGFEGVPALVDLGVKNGDTLQVRQSSGDGGGTTGTKLTPEQIEQIYDAITTFISSHRTETAAASATVTAAAQAVRTILNHLGKQELSVGLQKAHFKFKRSMSDRKIARILTVIRDYAEQTGEAINIGDKQIHIRHEKDQSSI